MNRGLVSKQSGWYCSLRCFWIFNLRFSKWNMGVWYGTPMWLWRCKWLVKGSILAMIEGHIPIIQTLVDILLLTIRGDKVSHFSMNVKSTHFTLVGATTIYKSEVHYGSAGTSYKVVRHFAMDQVFPRIYCKTPELDVYDCLCTDIKDLSKYMNHDESSKDWIW